MSFNYKRIIVLGNNGSGKSYFSEKLADITGLPLIHLDLLYWGHGWRHPDREDWIKIQQKIMFENEWIIDGMYISTLEYRFKESELIYFLDIDTAVCIEAINKREGVKRKDFPNYLDKNPIEFEKLYRGAMEFESKRKPIILELHKKYFKKNFVVLKTRQEIEDYLTKLAQNK